MTRADDIEVPALGRVADLGYLYDARTERFYASIFTEKIKSIKPLEQTKFFMNASFTNSPNEKLSLFKIEAELGVGILFNLFPLGGSVDYLVKEKKSARKSEGTIFVSAQTQEQHLDIYLSSYKDKWNRDLLKTTQATHVVSGIKWGANVAVTLTETFEEVQSNTNKSGKLSTVINIFKAMNFPTGTSSLGSEGHDFMESSKFEITVHGDVIFPSFPQSSQEIKDFISKIPGSIGKGVRLVYTLVPLTHICQVLKVESPPQELLTKISESINDSLIKICNDLSNLEQRLNDLQDDFTRSSIFPIDEQGSSLPDFIDHFQTSKKKFKDKIKDALEQVKKGQCKIKVLSDILDDFNTANDYNLPKVEQKLQGFIKEFNRKSENVRSNPSQSPQAYGALRAEDGSVNNTVNQKDYSSFITTTRAIPSNHANFGCSGTIQLPSKKESIFLDFKLPTTNGSQQRCLWTMSASQNNNLVLFKVKVTVLCQHPPHILNDNTLTFTEWHGINTHNSNNRCKQEITTNRISFNAKTMDSEAGFILRVDVLDTTHIWQPWPYLSYSSSSATHTKSVGTATYSFSSFFDGMDYTSVVINPQPAAKVTLIVTVELWSSNKSKIEEDDIIKILEFGMDGVPEQVGRFRGSRSTVLYVTKNPVAALVSCIGWVAIPQQQVEMSWK